MSRGERPQQYRCESFASNPKAEVCLHQPFLQEGYRKKQFINNWAGVWGSSTPEPAEQSAANNSLSGVSEKAKGGKNAEFSSLSPYKRIRRSWRIICPLSKCGFGVEFLNSRANVSSPLGNGAGYSSGSAGGGRGES